MTAEIQCSPPGGAGRSPAPSHGIFATSCNRGQPPTPFVPIISGGWFVDPAMHHGKVAFADGSCGELSAEPGQRFRASSQQHNSAGVPVQAMDGMDGMMIVSESRQPTPFKGRLDHRTQIDSWLVVNAQPAGFFDDDPSPTAGNAGNRTGRAVDRTYFLGIHGWMTSPYRGRASHAARASASSASAPQRSNRRMLCSIWCRASLNRCLCAYNRPRSRYA